MFDINDENETCTMPDARHLFTTDRRDDENNIIQQVFFLGGCSGNLQGIGATEEGTHRG